MNEYCVYAYLRADSTPYYVGMGKSKRPYAQHKRGCMDLRPSDKSRIVIIANNLTRQEALVKETEEIARYGLKEEGGLLQNLTSGGESPQMTFETRMRMSRAARGVSKNPESIKKMVATRRQNGSFCPSEETRLKLSLSHKGLSAGAKNPAARAVVAYDKAGNELGIFQTAREAASELEIGECWKHISAVCRGKRPHTCGFVFKYA